MTISEQELEIFSRQLILKELDEKTFNFIHKQHEVIIGMGAGSITKWMREITL